MIDPTISLLNELLIDGLDFSRPTTNITNNAQQNGTHAFRFFIRYLSKTKYIIISPAEYHHLINLQKRIDLRVRLEISPWHWGSLIPQGEWSILFHYTQQPATYFHGIGRIPNIPLQNNIFRYANRPILIRKGIVSTYLEISNDINLLPHNLIGSSVRDIVVNSNQALRRVWLDIIWGSNSVIELGGDRFRLINNWDGYRYYNFYQRLGEVEGNEEEIRRQINNIIRDQGRGNRRLLY